jgi:hypothetical protein
MSARLRVSESGRGLPVPVDVDELREKVVAVGDDIHGSGSCIARKPETKHPPYAWSASKDAAFRSAVSCIATRSPSSDSSQSIVSSWYWNSLFRAC